MSFCEKVEVLKKPKYDFFQKLKFGFWEKVLAEAVLGP